jgi:hypothetical protein
LLMPSCHSSCRTMVRTHPPPPMLPPMLPPIKPQVGESSLLTFSVSSSFSSIHSYLHNTFLQTDEKGRSPLPLTYIQTKPSYNWGSSVAHLSFQQSPSPYGLSRASGKPIAPVLVLVSRHSVRCCAICTMYCCRLTFSLLSNYDV